jgi:hypothetical protein
LPNYVGRTNRQIPPRKRATKHRYLGFLSDAKRLSAGTVEQVAAALADLKNPQATKISACSGRSRRRATSGAYDPQAIADRIPENAQAAESQLQRIRLTETDEHFETEKVLAVAETLRSMLRMWFA